MATAPKPKPVSRGTKSGGPMLAKPAPKATEKPNAIEKLVQDVTNRYRVTAREARDIVTAVSTAAKVTSRTIQGKETFNKPSQLKEIAKQVKEVGTAAVTGKKGTTPAEIKKVKNTTYVEKGNSRAKPKGPSEKDYMTPPNQEKLKKK